MVADWISHTPKDVLAKNFGVPPSTFDKTYNPDLALINSTISTKTVEGGKGALTGNSSYTFHISNAPEIQVPGGGGTIQIVDSKNFPVSKTIACAVVRLKPGGMRELHWHPTVSLSLYAFTPTSISSNHLSYRLRSGSTSTAETPVLLSTSVVVLPEPSTSPLVMPVFSQTTLATILRTPLRPRSLSTLNYTRPTVSLTSPSANGSPLLLQTSLLPPSMYQSRSLSRSRRTSSTSSPKRDTRGGAGTSDYPLRTNTFIFTSL